MLYDIPDLGTTNIATNFFGWLINTVGVPIPLVSLILLFVVTLFVGREWDILKRITAGFAVSFAVSIFWVAWDMMPKEYAYMLFGLMILSFIADYYNNE